ncbi:MAG: lysophospholipid acyltransferase family protein [Planctomycetota bacterium]
MGEEVAPPASWPNAAAYWCLWATVGTTARLAFRVAVQGRLPRHGPCVVVANHASFLDPVVLGAACRRRIFFLMDAVLCRTPPLRWFYRLSRVIPVDPRGSNREALRRARAELDRGHVIGIFPEGGISRDGSMVLGNTGAVSLALNGDVPVVPVGIVGAYGALPAHRSLPSFRRVRVHFGTPMLPSDLLADGGVAPPATDPLSPTTRDRNRKVRLRVATRRVMDAVAALAGQTSREAELEGRARAR